MASAGRLTGAGATGCRMTTRASLVTNLTLDHIILGYVFSREVWAACLKSFRLLELIPTHEERIMDWWTTSRKRLLKVLRRGFDSLFFLVGWNVWKERNGRTFDRAGRQP